MKVFVCGESYEEIMSCIYDAWVCALKLGHENIKIEKNEYVQQSLFAEYEYPEVDLDKVEKVTRAIKTKISPKVFTYIMLASLSYQPDAPDAIYRYMILGFKVGKKLENMMTEPEVLRIFELNRQVSNEIHFGKELTRFNSVDNSVYVAHMDVKSNVVYMVADHFADRMPSENFVLIDDKRRLAAVHPRDQETYLRHLTDEEFTRLSTTDTYEDEFSSMWRTFFYAIAIKERENLDLQRNHFPLWKRKHATEFK